MDPNEYAALLLNYAEENWSAFERWLQSMGYTYTEEELDKAAAAIRKRAGQA